MVKIEKIKFEDYFERALKSPSPTNELLKFAKELISKGYDEDELYQVFEKFRAKLRDENREKDEDNLMEIMDYIVG